MYLCIDMKCFFASVECALRGLNPLTTPLVVADIKKGEGALCLAVSPYLKKKGVKNRCRLLEIHRGFSYIIAKPRMRKYIDYAAKIHAIFLRYVSEDNIHTYSIDESFLEIASYGTIEQQKKIAFRILSEIKEELGLVGACGAGENIFLSKIALDILAKKMDSNYYYLDKNSYYKEIWQISDLTKIWQIGPGISKRLQKLGVRTVKDIAYLKEDVLVKEFGVIGKDLYMHSWGIDDTTIKDIKSYCPINNNFSRSQVLFHEYSKETCLVPLIEMLYLLCVDLHKSDKICRTISIYIGYLEKDSFHKTFSLDYYTNDYFLIKKKLKEVYKTIEEGKIKRIGICFSSLIPKKNGINTLFFEQDSKVDDLYTGIVNIWEKYGKSSLVIGTAVAKESTIFERNKQIGGHNSD